MIKLNEGAKGSLQNLLKNSFCRPVTSYIWQSRGIDSTGEYPQILAKKAKKKKQIAKKTVDEALVR